MAQGGGLSVREQRRREEGRKEKGKRKGEKEKERREKEEKEMPAGFVATVASRAWRRREATRTRNEENRENLNDV